LGEEHLLVKRGDGWAWQCMRLSPLRLWDVETRWYLGLYRLLGRVDNWCAYIDESRAIIARFTVCTVPPVVIHELKEPNCTEMLISTLNFKNGPSAISRPQYLVQYISEVFKYGIQNTCNGAPDVGYLTSAHSGISFFAYRYYVKKIYIKVSHGLYYISVCRLIMYVVF